MKLSIIIFLILNISGSTCYAIDDYQSNAMEANKHSVEQMSIYREDAEKAKKTEKSITRQYEQDAQFAEKKANEIINNNIQHKPNASKPMSSVLVFVSFSMPRQSLEEYLRDAKKIHASVIIRGLIDNSFQKTFLVIANLVKTSGGEGVELNPLWFKRFGIKEVPAVVIVPEGSACFKQDICSNETDFDVMKGDITLAAALKIIRDKGQFSNNLAQAALDTLQDRSHE